MLTPHWPTQFQALENAPSEGYTKVDLSNMVEETVNKEAVIIRKEMSLLKENIVEKYIYIYMQTKSKQSQPATQ